MRSFKIHVLTFFGVICFYLFVIICYRSVNYWNKMHACSDQIIIIIQSISNVMRRLLMTRLLNFLIDQS